MHIDDKNVLGAINHLEVIRVALAKIGATCTDDQEKLKLTLCYFFIDYNVFEKITMINRMLIDEAEKDKKLSQKLECLLKNIGYWDKISNVTEEDLSNLISNKNKSSK